MLSAVKIWSLVIASWVLCLAVLVVGFMLFVDGTIWKPVVTYERAEFPVSQKVYTPGETVVARVEAYKSRDLVGTIQCALVNHKMTYFLPRPLPMPHGVIDVWAPMETIPDCSSGQYHIECTVSYPVNILNLVTYKVRTEEFEIINNRRMP